MIVPAERRIVPRRSLAALAAFLFLLVPEPALAATDVPVRVTAGPDELRPVASLGYYAWMQASKRDNDAYDVFAQVSGGAPFRVNPKRTEGVTGGLDGSRLVYELRPRRGDTDIRAVDLATRSPIALPKGVNTKKLEFAPSISGDYLLFGRAARRRPLERILVMRLSTGEVRVLGTSQNKHRFLGVGQVNGQYAVWYDCGKASCAVYRDRLDVPPDSPGSGVVSPADTYYYTPGVATDGTVYFFRSGRRCGTDVALMKWNGVAGNPATLVHDLPDGVDAAGAFVFQPSAREIHYGRVRCGGREPSDLHKILE